MNPARSFGPAFVQGFFDHHIYYWLAPIAGGVVGALVYQYLILEKQK
jgi:glycerol uptake facilitator-like aquaporin